MRASGAQSDISVEDCHLSPWTFSAQADGVFFLANNRENGINSKNSSIQPTFLKGKAAVNKTKDTILSHRRKTGGSRPRETD